MSVEVMVHNLLPLRSKHPYGLSYKTASGSSENHSPRLQVDLSLDRDMTHFIHLCVKGMEDALKPSLLFSQFQQTGSSTPGFLQAKTVLLL